MAIDEIGLVDRVALLRKSWQKSLRNSLIRGGGLSEITERESERDGERGRTRILALSLCDAVKPLVKIIAIILFRPFPHYTRCTYTIFGIFLLFAPCFIGYNLLQFYERYDYRNCVVIINCVIKN